MTNKELREELTHAVALLRIPGVGRGRYHRLVKAFGSAEKALAANVSQLETVIGISHAIATEIKTRCDLETAGQIAARVIQLGWTVHLPEKPDYPERLLNIPTADIPPVLFCEGLAGDADEKMIAIVGTRHPTEQGRMFAYSLAASLAKAGITVVSGMAEGIDSAAHKGALEAGGRTAAVWGSSLDIVYPPSNKTLALKIREQGLVYSEYLPQTDPNKAHFPERNRIISGLSDGVVVVEAGQRSGALITANYAIEQSRELFAVPGQPGSKTSEGSNFLIKQGARLITSVEDIFDELPRLKGEVLSKQFSRLPDLTEPERKIVALFASGPRQVDQISREMVLPVPEVMEYLLALELKGVVKELSGKRFVLAEEYA